MIGDGADIAGAVLVTGALMLGVYTILEAGDYGWGSLRTLGFGAIALALFAAGLARPTARRLLLTLEELGFVRSSAGAFALTPKVLTLGMAYVAALMLFHSDATVWATFQRRLVTETRARPTVPRAPCPPWPWLWPGGSSP